MKTDIYNLIILDESGSMSCVTNQTISGCNETLNTIRSAQKKFEETQEHHVSIYAFQSQGDRPSRYIIKNAPIDAVKDITEKDYQPDGWTPLYDAVGSTLVDLKTTVNEKELAIGSVTIITDGMENSSERYTLGKIASMIDALKEAGWNFNFIGANIDVVRTAGSLHIDNALEFDQSDEGMDTMFRKEAGSRMAYYRRADRDIRSCRAPEGVDKKNLYERLKKSGKNYFNEE